MEIVQYDRQMASRVAEAYNAAVTAVPHCYPAAAEDVAAAIDPAGRVGDDEKRMHSQTTFVAPGGGSVLGFVNVGVGAPHGPPEGEQGVIRFLHYRPGERAVGQALLEAAEACLRRRGAAYVQAFPQEYRYRFYHLHAAHMSERLAHVEALLSFNGYRRIRGEVFLDWPDFEPADPRPAGVAADISVKWRPGRGSRPGVNVEARQGARQIGGCTCVSCGEFSRAAEAQDWLFTESLWVADELQGKGLGRHLLLRALKEMRGAGYRHAAISTALGNHRAFLFYTNYGYRVVDWTYGFGREIGG